MSNRLIELYESGLSTHKIADLFDTGQSQVHRELIGEGIKLRPGRYILNDEDRQEVCILKRSGLPTSCIANRYKIDKRSVNRIVFKSKDKR